MADKAKILDTVEAVYHIPAGMLNAPGQHCYQMGVEFAEDVAGHLAQAISTYHREIGDNMDRAEARDRRDGVRLKAVSTFWHQAERAVPVLLTTVDGGKGRSDARSWSQSDWGRTIRSAARQAYELGCPSGTARQMRAFVQGLAKLFPSRQANETQKTP